MKKKRQLLRETGEARAASATDGDFVPLDSSKVGPNNSEHSRRDPMSDSRSAVSQAPGKAPGRESGVVREEDEVGEGDEFFEEYAGSKIAFGTQPGRDAAERRRAIKGSLREEYCCSAEVGCVGFSASPAGGGLCGARLWQRGGGARGRRRARGVGGRAAASRRRRDDAGRRERRAMGAVTVRYQH